MTTENENATREHVPTNELLHDEKIRCPFCGDIPEVLSVFGEKNVFHENDECPLNTIGQQPILLVEWKNRWYPEGCSPADARKLREFNHALAEENTQLKDAIRDWLSLNRDGCSMEADESLEQAAYKMGIDV